MARSRETTQGLNRVLTEFFDSSVPPSATVNEIRRAGREAMRASIDDWHGSVLPKHFKPGAFYAYNYQQRTARTRHDKTRMAKRSGVPSHLPLVYRGHTMRIVTAALGRIQVSAVRGSFKGKLTLTVPEYVLINRHIDLFGEITQMNVRDRERFASIFFGLIEEAF